MKFLKKLFGSRNERVLRQLYKNVSKINALEPGYQQLSDAELKAKTAEFKTRLANGATLDDILPEAFATVRETSRRVLKMRHFDVQLIGGMVLHQGKIAEMRTGEGKTLMSTLPAYLNALTGKGVYLVTVNDYLAQRDANWMRPVYDFLGLTTGVILSGLTNLDRHYAYQCDIVYGTNNEFGFDYLRDNLAFSLEERVQRELNFAIVDEVDSILIDEARTPLIISGAAQGNNELYVKINQLIPLLTKQEKAEDTHGDFYLDEKSRQAFLTEQGHQKAEEWLTKSGLLDRGDSLYDPSNIMLMHHINAALRAHALYHRDVEYIVMNNEVVIVDEHTGRTMPGRRWSEGLHQAIEAKEGVTIQSENQTLASITFQNYFRLFNKLAGMTGTADTEAYEFQQIYGLEVVVIPTNKPMVRKDNADQIYLTMNDKFNAVVADIKACLARQQPVLVGTASIETSEYLSNLLQKERIAHQVLNAKFHEKEAQIIAEAGRPGAVTIATNMAGRGTDIVLGGNLEAEIHALQNPTDADIARVKAEWQKRHEHVIAAGGLHVIGSERHESRRIDNQLRGRSGRQGDPGSSRFYLSLQDNLMRIFASDRVAMIMQKLGMKEGESIEHPWVTKAIENAQRKVEAHNFDIRKQLLEYDDVANDQRKVIYSQRTELMHATDINDTITAIRADVVNDIINTFIPPQTLEEQWNIAGLERQFEADFGLHLPIQKWLAEESDLHEENLRERLLKAVVDEYQQKEAQVGAPVMRQLEKSIMLQFVDNHWREHLSDMDYLRQGIHLRGYAQKNPKQEYKRESFELFSNMLQGIKHDVITTLSKVRVQAAIDAQEFEHQRAATSIIQNLEFSHVPAAPVLEAVNAEEEVEETPQMAHVVPFVRQQPKVGRNDPCPCGSGKKYKQCHGQLD